MEFDTDPIGLEPHFFRPGHGKPIVARRPEDVIPASARSIDPVSAADFILNGSICFPYTFFERVRVIDPGSRVRVLGDGLAVRQYYQPAEAPEQGALEDWAIRIRETLRDVLTDSLQGVQRPLVLFSGGEDSRVIAAMLLEIGIKPALVTFSGSMNREVALARRAARSLGLDLTILIRSDREYEQDICRRAHAIGPGFDLRHGHLLPSLESELPEHDCLIGGFKADAMLKAKPCLSNIAPARNPFKAGDRLLLPYPDRPIFVSDPFARGWISEDMAHSVNVRRSAHHQRIAEIRPRSAGNWHPLWPVASQDFLHAHYRTCKLAAPKYCEPFLDWRMFRLAAEMPDSFRLDARAFRRAFAQILGSAGWRLASGGRVPRLYGPFGRNLQRGTRLTWRILDNLRSSAARRHGTEPMNQSAWPKAAGRGVDINAILNSDQIASLAQLCQRISGAKLGSSRLELILARMDYRERFRAIQVACFMG